MENQKIESQHAHEDQQLGHESENERSGGQSEIQEAADDSSQVKQLQAYQNGANQSSQVTQLMQLQSSANQRSSNAGQMRSAPPVQLTSGPLQLKPKYAKLNPQSNFSKKHLHSSASQSLAAAQLVARKYRGWQSSTSKHTVIPKGSFPGAWQVPAIGTGYKTSKPLTTVGYQYIASDPEEVTAGSEWTVNSKTTAKNPSVAGTVSALGSTESHSNGSGNVNCDYEMSVNHLAGAGDQGLNPTTVEWDGTDYKVTVSGNESTFAKATVEQ